MEDLEYKEEEAIDFIFNYLNPDIKKTIQKTDIELVLDLIFDFYDENGYLEDSEEETVEISENEIFNYIMDKIRNDKRLTEEIIGAILEGEYEYSKSIGVFSEDEKN